MSSIYIPPHVRARREPPDRLSEGGDSDKGFEVAAGDEHIGIEDIFKHFCPDGFFTKYSVHTLNSAQEDPHSIKYVILYPGAHPRWKDNIIFTKTDIGLLPGYVEQKNKLKQELICFEERHAEKPNLKEGKEKTAEKDEEDDIAGAVTRHEGSETQFQRETLREGSLFDNQANTRTQNNIKTSLNQENTHPGNNPDFIDYVPPAHDPIAFFRARDGSGKNCTFIGWYTIINICILPPLSPGIKRLLQQKFAGSNVRGKKNSASGGFLRTRDAWNKSINSEWAVVRVRKLHVLTTQCPPEPQIRKYKPPAKEQPASASKNERAAVEEENFSNDEEREGPHTETGLQNIANLLLESKDDENSKFP